MPRAVSLEKRRTWVAAGNCFVCNQPREFADVTTAYCLYHYILRNMRVRRLFIYRLDEFVVGKKSRVREERLKKREYIVHALRARFMAVRSGGAVQFSSLREVMEWIDNLWTALALWHSFPLRLTNFAVMVRYILHLDYLAARDFRPKKETLNAPLEIHHDPSLVDEGQPDGLMERHPKVSRRNQRMERYRIPLRPGDGE